MTARARRFRIEACGEPRPEFSGVDQRHQELLAAIADLKASLGADTVRHETDNIAHTGGGDALALKEEMDAIRDAIAQTKEELTTLRLGQRGRDLARVTDELDAVVRGTEAATEDILKAAEAIDRDAGDLQAALKKTGNIATVEDVREQVVRIFEACNFQDLTGQRINKVMATMRFVEERVERMTEIWVGLESLGAGPVVIEDDEPVPGSLENGPRLDGDEGHASQEDIDALFK